MSLNTAHADDKGVLIHAGEQYVFSNHFIIIAQYVSISSLENSLLKCDLFAKFFQGRSSFLIKNLSILYKIINAFLPNITSAFSSLYISQNFYGLWMDFDFHFLLYLSLIISLNTLLFIGKN